MAGQTLSSTENSEASPFGWMGAPAPQAQADTRDRPARILLVEDNRGDVLLARRNLFGDDGLSGELLVARTAREALDTLRAESGEGGVDLILLDISLPGEDGFVFLRHLRAERAWRGIPVVMCTGSGHAQDRHNARDLGVVGYITKPPRLDNLRDIIDTVPFLELKDDDDGLRLYTVRV